MSCEHDMFEMNCAECDTIDRVCLKCGFGSGHGHSMPEYTVTI